MVKGAAKRKVYGIKEVVPRWLASLRVIGRIKVGSGKGYRSSKFLLLFTISGKSLVESNANTLQPTGSKLSWLTHWVYLSLKFVIVEPRVHISMPATRERTSVSRLLILIIRPLTRS